MSLQNRQTLGQFFEPLYNENCVSMKIGKIDFKKKKHTWALLIAESSLRPGPSSLLSQVSGLGLLVVELSEMVVEGYGGGGRWWWREMMVEGDGGGGR